MPWRYSRSRQALNGGNRGNAQGLERTIGLIHLGNESAEPVDILVGPNPHIASKAEVPLRGHEQHPDVAFARCMACRREAFADVVIGLVLRGLGEHYAADCAVAFETDRFHEESPWLSVGNV